MCFAARFRPALPVTDHGFSGRVSLAAWGMDESDMVTVEAHRPVQAASTIKILILITALRHVRDGRLSLGTELPLPASEQRVGGTGVLRELASVHRLDLADLLALMIVVSDNAATGVVIDAVGFDAVNACAQDLGCTTTRVQRHLMDIDAMIDGWDNVTSAMDQAQILDRLVRGTALPDEFTRWALDVLSRQQMRDRLPALLPVSAECWNKTGEQIGLRHDVGLIGSGGRPQAVIAVLVDQLTDEHSLSGYRGGPGCDLIADLGARAYSALSP